MGAVACAQVLGVEFDSPATPRDAAADSPEPAPKAGAEVCRAIPGRPTTASSDKEMELVFVLKCVNFGDDPSYDVGECPSPRLSDGGVGTPGLDLDGGGGACASNAPSTNACGVDNALLRVLAGLKVGLGLSDAGARHARSISSHGISDGLNDGLSSVILRIRRYNGEPDDDAVDVAWLLPVTYDGSPDWSGTDRWRVSTHSLVPQADGSANAYDLDHPRYASTRAYVAKGELVATFDEAEFVIPSARMPLVLHDVTLAAHLRSTDDYWLLERGVLGARGDARELLADLGRFQVEDPSFAGKFCPGEVVFNLATTAVCNFADLPTPTSGECTSLSAGATFYGVSQATPLEIVVNDLPPRCDAGVAASPCAQ